MVAAGAPVRRRLLVLGTWFSGTAVAGSLRAEWRIDAIGLASLTVAVQLGFAVGAVALAALGVPDVLPARWLIAAGAVVATQFSTAISELAPPGTAGSALTLQTASGFLLTAVTIWGVSLLNPGDAGSWRIAFALLALGPAVGIWAMWRLRHRPDAVRMASGRR
jgi:hypothetical protein